MREKKSDVLETLLVQETSLPTTGPNFPEHSGERKELLGTTCRFWRGLSEIFARGTSSLQKKQIATI